MFKAKHESNHPWDQVNQWGFQTKPNLQKNENLINRSEKCQTHETRSMKRCQSTIRVPKLQNQPHRLSLLKLNKPKTQLIVGV